MSIVVTSVPDTNRLLLPTHVRQLGHSILNIPLQKRKLLIFRSFISLLVIIAVLGGDAFIRSYKYYSQIIDARLASGYLTSRPGLYAAPRVLHSGQNFPIEKLVHALRRAGYVESAASEAWSGSFIRNPDSVEIRPVPLAGKQPRSVIVRFAGERISEIVSDGASLDSFTLEPEALSNDISSKGGKREVLTFKEIPPVLVRAILAIEDRRFFDHSGVDVSGLIRAALRNVADERMTQGGSTITQQLIKNTYLSSEKTLSRKYAEAILAISLERRLSKDDIFALYCNEIYLGQRGAGSVRGVKEAASTYFGKQLNELTLAEAATIAGMIQGPARYSPVAAPEAAKARRDAVLDAMQRAGVISQIEAKNALSEPLTVTTAIRDGNSLAPYSVDFVTRTAKEFDASGATQRIYTTIDLELQQLAEESIKHELDLLAATDSNTTPQDAS